MPSTADAAAPVRGPDPWITLLEALPLGFDFYHLGRIELENEENSASPDLTDPAAFSDHFGIGFRFEGEIRGALVLLVGEGLDSSTYSEAGNIIASRIATRLSSEQGLEVTVSPPQLLSRPQLRALIASGHARFRNYVHRHGALAITLQAALLPDSRISPLSAEGTAPEATGHA